MPASHLLLHYGYFIVIVALGQVPPHMLEQASEAAAAAVMTSNNNTLFSSLGSNSPPSLLLAVDVEKGAEPRPLEHGLETSNLPLAERSPLPSSSPGLDQKQSEDIRRLARLAYVSNFTLINALILQITQFTLAYLFAKSMSPNVSPCESWQDRRWAIALPGIAIKNTFTSLGACKRLYHAWTGNLEVLKLRRSQGALTFAGLGAFFTTPLILLWPIVWIWSRSQ